MSDLSVAEELRIALVGFGLDKDLRRHLVHAVQRIEERLAELEGAVDLRCSAAEDGNGGGNDNDIPF